jgi:CheY-like chemotaxis protein
MKEFFTVPYIDDSADNQRRLQKSIVRTEIALHIQPFLSAGSAMTYLHGEPPFENQRIFPSPAFFLCSDGLKGIDSPGIVACIRAISTCAALPIIMLGQSADALSVSKCYAAGADYFLHQPRAPARLDVLVRTLYACAAFTPPSFEGLEDVPEHHRSAPDRSCA